MAEFMPTQRLGRLYQDPVFMNQGINVETGTDSRPAEFLEI